MDPFIVLVTEGSGYNVDSAMVVIFDSKDDAEDYCLAKISVGTKYWTMAQIVESGEEISLCSPKD